MLKAAAHLHEFKSSLPLLPQAQFFSADSKNSVKKARRFTYKRCGAELQ